MITESKNTIGVKNEQSGAVEFIEQHGLETRDWGFRFFVDAEFDAYRAAYHYRFSKHGVKVEFARGAKRWMVTVFNSSAAAMGIDGAV